jgi:hypothetical protein
MYQSDSQKPAPTNNTPDSPHARESAESILRRARERANGGRYIEAMPDEALPWVHDSWIGECEAAGVYSRKPPAYDYSEEPAIAVTLTRAEVTLLAQRHLNTAMDWEEFYAWNGLAEKELAVRSMIHDARSHVLADLLPPEDQHGFRRQIEIRDRYIASVRAEVFRCEKAESEFWSWADAGLVSEAEITAHKPPPFIAGHPGMPSPADGGPAPEAWDLYS